MKTITKLSLWLCVLWVSVTPVAHASAVTNLFFADDFTIDQDTFRGTWKNAQTWRGTLCNGSYSYDINLNGKISKLDFTMAEDGSLDAYGDLSQIFGRIGGKYRSSYSLCTTLGSALSAEVERFEVRAKVNFVEKAEGLEIKLKIYETKIHRVYFSKYLPAWFEKFLSGILDKALNYVWGTSLGDLINKKISEQLKGQFPDGITVSLD
ncbi:MAG: hypothetical protein KDD51_13240 [Bdellovibrionales bacterium]|nr:hypothetical protein [Bdellovibrionales bacterium]